LPEKKRMQDRCCSFTLVTRSKRPPPPKRPVHSIAPPTFDICSSIPLLYCTSTRHAHITPTMPPHTPMQHLLLRSRTAITSTTPLILLQQCSLHQPTTRLFTTTSLLSAGVRKSKSFAPHQTGMKQPSQKSFEVMKKEQMKNIDQMPNDVGLIPGTFIMPTGSRLPSDLGKRVKLERYRAWLRIKEVFG
jgi:hypothetical protein